MTDDILYKHNYYRDSISRALDITRDYVIEHKLVLTGGTAIDLALRTKNKNIYEDTAVPDYDIISDTNLQHAQALANILCKSELEDINVINAFHMTTVRVRYKRFPLLDATYVPSSVISHIPYLDVPCVTHCTSKMFRVIHPHYQLIDQYLSLSNLMQTTGISFNIQNRLTKDLERNKMIRDNFPLDNPKTRYTTTLIKLPLDILYCDDSDIISFKTTTIEQINVVTNDLCCYGFVAYALLCNEYLNLCSANKIKPVDIVDTKLKINSSNIQFHIPLGEDISFLSCTDNMNAIVSKVKKLIGNSKMKKYNRLLDLKGISIKLDYTKYEFEIIDSYANRYNCNLVKVNDKYVSITNCYKVLAYMLTMYYYKSNNLYLNYYHSLLNMILHIQDTDIMNELFFPSINMYGKNDHPETYYFGLYNIIYPDTNNLRPKNLYPIAPVCKTNVPFDYSTSDFYNGIDGNENKKIKEMNHSELIRKRNEL